MTTYGLLSRSDDFDSGWDNRSDGRRSSSFAALKSATGVPGLDHQVVPLLAEIQANLHRRFTIAGLAATAHVSPRTFARRFVAATGSTPHQWLIRQRVLLAQQLLEEDDLTIDEISRRTGFGTADLLRHHFQQQVATTPTGYRRTFSHQPGA
jgi:transcriptional regulator GlxA family with amidase domain